MPNTTLEQRLLWWLLAHLAVFCGGMYWVGATVSRIETVIIYHERDIKDNKEAIAYLKSEIFYHEKESQKAN